MLLAAGAVLLLLWIAAFTLRRPAPPAQSTVPGGLGLVTDAKMQIVRAYENRTGGRIPDAIGNLSEGLRLAGGDKAVTRQLYQDRAFCYKLGGDWEKAVADLTSALSIYDGMAPAERATMLSDRGDAYFRLRDLELALADYQALAAIQPKAPTVIRDYLAATLRARGSFTTAFFLFTEVGPIDQNNSSVIPPAIRPLEKFSEYLNLRFWWHQVPAAELRYTSRDDTGLAMRVADILRSGGLVVGSPVLLNSLVPRSRRIELWFQRSKPPGSDAR
jgi:tetratricopeptide (TPR) repeat protein